MAKSVNQKLKLVRLIEIFLKQTDQEHPITLSEIIKMLDSYGIGAERKSLYDDIETIRQLGFEIVSYQNGRTYYYYMGEKQFEIAELKCLVDAIQSSKFLSVKQSNQMIKKLESLASVHEAKQLQRQVFVNGRTKVDNKNFFYNVDGIYAAIDENKKIRFHYYQWNRKKEKELRKEGSWYEVSPWALAWDDEYYYLIAYDADAGKLKHYRVDKMQDIESIDGCREGKEHFEQRDMPSYMKMSFGMYGGKEEIVKLVCDNDIAGVIIDRFGTDIIINPIDEEHFSVNLHVAVSKPFFGWLFGLGNKARIEGPIDVIKQMKAMLGAVGEMY